jgi:anti-anti-sigma factor
METEPPMEDRYRDLFRCELGFRGGAWWLAPCGELDMAAMPHVEWPVRIACTGGEDVVVDLRGLTFMDSSGLHLIVRLLRASREHGFGVVFVRGTAAIERVLEVSGVREHAVFLDSFASDADATERAVIATDLAGGVTVWNSAAERLYGWSAGEVIGRPITELTVGPDDRALAEEIMEGVRRDGSWQGAFEVRRRDGARFTAHVRDLLVQDRDGLACGLVGVSAELSTLVEAVA